MNSQYDWIGWGCDGAIFGEYNAIYYKKDKFTLLDSDQVWLAEGLPSLPTKGWDASLNRIITWGKFRDNSTYQEFYLFNTHFDHKGPIAKVESAKAMRGLVFDTIINNKIITPTFLSGDFNSSPTSEAADQLKIPFIYTGHDGSTKHL